MEQEHTQFSLCVWGGVRIEDTGRQVKEGIPWSSYMKNGGGKESVLENSLYKGPEVGGEGAVCPLN